MKGSHGPCYIHQGKQRLWVISLFSVVLSVSRERSVVPSWIPPKVTMLHGSQRRKFFKPNLLRRASIRKCLDQISLSDTLKLSSLRLSLILENGGHASLPLKVFRTESRGEILVRREGCNTPGVCRQLSSGFELQHDKFSGNQELQFKLVSGDKGVGINSLRMSPNLNLDNTPLLLR